jgi:hypothetical protein
LLRRSILAWLTIRVGYVILLMIGVLFFGILPLQEGIEAAIQPILLTRAFLVVLTLLVVWLDRTRSHELLLQHNLGASPIWFWFVSLASAILLDFLVQGLVIRSVLRP